MRTPTVADVLISRPINHLFAYHYHNKLCSFDISVKVCNSTQNYVTFLAAL